MIKLYFLAAFSNCSQSLDMNSYSDSSRVENRIKIQYNLPSTISVSQIPFISAHTNQISNYGVNYENNILAQNNQKSNDAQVANLTVHSGVSTNISSAEQLQFESMHIANLSRELNASPSFRQSFLFNQCGSSQDNISTLNPEFFDEETQPLEDISDNMTSAHHLTNGILERNFIFSDNKDQLHATINSKSNLKMNSQSENSASSVEMKDTFSITKNKLQIDKNAVKSRKYLANKSRLQIRLYRIKESIKIFESILESYENENREDKIISLCIFYLRQVYYFFKINSPKNLNFSEIYDLFKNVVIDKSLEMMKIRTDHQLKNIQKHLENTFEIILLSLNDKKFISKKGLVSKLKFEMKELMKWIGLNNFSILEQLNSLSAKRIYDLINIQKSSIEVEKTIENGCSNFELKFEEPTAQKLISMCVVGSIAYVIYLHKYSLTLNIRLIKINLDTYENMIFTHYFINSEQNRKRVFTNNLVKITNDIKGNLYLLCCNNTGDEFEIIVLDQNLVKLRSLTEDKYIGDLKVEKASVKDIVIHNNLIYLFDPENFKVAVYDYRFKLKKILNISEYIKNSTVNFFMISNRYIHLIADDKMFLCPRSNERFTAQNLPFKPHIHNATCSKKGNMIILKDKSGRIKCYKFSFYQGIPYYKILKNFVLSEHKFCKYATFEIFNDNLYALSSKNSTIYSVKLV